VFVDLALTSFKNLLRRIKHLYLAAERSRLNIMAGIPIENAAAQVTEQASPCKARCRQAGYPVMLVIRVADEAVNSQQGCPWHQVEFLQV
jgi:hypothetical protein